MSKIVQQDINQIIKNIKKEIPALAGRTILITGSSGFLGSYFQAVFTALNKTTLKKKPVKLICLDNYVTGERENILGEFASRYFKQIEHDVVKPLKISGDVNYIVHAAGIASPVYYMARPLETIEVATRGTQNMLNLAREKKVKSFLFFSSSEIYGDPHPEFIPTPEHYRGHVSSTGPRSCYDESKRLGEALCMTYWRLYKMPIKMVRPFNVYGPGMRPNDYRVMPKFLTAALNGEILPIHGNGLQTRTYCYATDATTGFIKALIRGRGGEVYNIGSDQDEINLLTLAKLISELFDDKVRMQKISYPAAYPADEPSRRCPDISKAKSHLNYIPKVDIKTGLNRLLEWYREKYY